MVSNDATRSSFHCKVRIPAVKTNVYGLRSIKQPFLTCFLFSNNTHITYVI